MEDIIEIEIRIEREVTYKEQSSWGMYGCVPTKLEDYSKVKLNKYGNMSVKGIVHRLDIGSVYKLTARIEEDKQWGTQYKILKMKQDLPVTPEQVKEYVRNFVTPLQLEAIYNVYEGQDVIELMKTGMFDYSLVNGFGQYTYDIVKARLLKNLELQELINEFPDLDFKILSKLLVKYSTVELLKEKLYENPYILTDVAGIGFRTADKIALEMGIAEDSPFRIHASMRHVMREVEAEGDTYIKEAKLISKSYELLKLRKPIIKAELDNVAELMKIDTRYCFKRTFEQESEVARMLLDRKANPKVLDFDVDKFLNEQEHKYQIKLTDQQKSFFHNFKNENVVLLIGYAGCGKSFLQKLLINLMEEMHLCYKLMAPTGKASKVLSQYTSRPAWTIHKATGLGKNEEEFSNVTIHDDVIIVDETSMCGIGLAHVLLTKIQNPEAKIVLIGDSFQIPSVDRGNFLYDLQESKMFATSMLDVVFRQKEGGILDIVTKVRLGEKFIDDNFKGVKHFGDNCILVSCPQSKMENGYMYYYGKSIKKYGKLGIMVLSPTKKAKLGTHAINRAIQNIVNPKRFEGQDEISLIKDKEEMFFRVDDYVMNTVNRYNMKTTDEKEVDIMNGETGIIAEVDIKERSLVVDFDGMLVVYKSENIDKLVHAYCITKHKSQGSASDYVISITDRSHTHQLNANLIYTAWTRARELLSILCQPEVLNRALTQFENLRRNTFLYEILKGEIELFKRELTSVE